MDYFHQKKLYNGKNSMHILLQGGSLIYFSHFDWYNQLLMGLISIHFSMNQGLLLFMSTSHRYPIHTRDVLVPRDVASTCLACIGYTQDVVSTSPCVYWIHTSCTHYNSTTENKRWWHHHHNCGHTRRHLMVLDTMSHLLWWKYGYFNLRITHFCESNRKNVNKDSL